MHVTVYVPAVFSFEVYALERGLYLSVEMLESVVNTPAKVGDDIFFITNLDVMAAGVITEIEPPGQNSKLGFLSEKQDRCRWKYHWSEGSCTLRLSALCAKDKSPRKIKLDVEDLVRVRAVKWYIKDKTIIASIGKRSVTLQRFILRRTDKYQVELIDKTTFDYRKVNLRVQRKARNPQNSLGHFT